MGITLKLCVYVLFEYAIDTMTYSIHINIKLIYVPFQDMATQISLDHKTKPTNVQTCIAEDYIPM
jgi:hypothetical protein